MKLHRILILIILLIGNTVIYSQKSCLNTLREAKELYEKGLIDEIPSLLSGCMESGFTRQQRVEAYKLIILAYLFDDDQFAAEKMMDEFLKKFPEYEVMPGDPVEFVYLLESYKTSSFYSLNLTFGPTFANPMILESHSVLDRSNTEYSNTTGIGFHVGFGLSRNLFKSVNGNITVYYSTYSYDFHEKSTTILGDRAFSFVDVDTKEELTRVEIPLTFTYSFGKGNLNYVIRAGGMFGYLIGADMTPRRYHEQLDNPISDPVDITEYRIIYDYAVVFGLGLEYKIPRGYLVLHAQYNMGLQNMVMDNVQDMSSRNYSTYYHIDDDFRLNSILISVGYHFSMYQSKKNRF